MSLSGLQKILSDIYNVDFYFNLNLIEKSPVTLLEQYLKLAKKSNYGNKDRIVFYSFDKLKKTYPGRPYDVLEDVQAMLYKFDIPPGFVLVASNDDDVKKDLKDLFFLYNVREVQSINFFKIKNINV